MSKISIGHDVTSRGVRSQMLFSHDTELALRAACALINSDRVDGEQLGDQAALDEYLNS